MAAAMRGLVLDGDETFVFVLALSEHGCDALVPDVDYVLSPGRLLTAMRSLPGKRMCRRPARGRRTCPRTGRGGTRPSRPRRGRGRAPPQASLASPLSLLVAAAAALPFASTVSADSTTARRR